MVSPALNEDHICRLDSDRRVGYACFGREGGVPAFYFHGLPGSRREGALLHQASLEQGVQLIAVDRPGYGMSDPWPGNRLAQWPQLVALLADHLDIDSFYLLAVSGGAPYALACASRLADRVKGTGICCGLSEVASADRRAEMRLNARLGFWLARRGPSWVRYTYGAVITPAARLVPALSVDLMGWLNGAADHAVLSQPRIRSLFAANLREAFRQGAEGGVADICAAIRPWPFELTGISNLQLWHGLADKVVPPSHSRYLAGAVPGARLELREGEGHFSMPIRYAQAIVAGLVSNTAASASRA